MRKSNLAHCHESLTQKPFTEKPTHGILDFGSLSGNFIQFISSDIDRNIFFSTSRQSPTSTVRDARGMFLFNTAPGTECSVILAISELVSMSKG